MKIRKTKENIQRMLDLAYDHAVMLQVLWYIWLRLKGKNNTVVRDDPFRDRELNNIFSFIEDELRKRKD